MRVWNITGGVQPVESEASLRERLLENRGVGLDEQEAFFTSSYVRDIHNPYDMANMEQAVARVMHAVRKGERIMVYGDYDADGITSTAIMVQTLSDVGAHVFPYLPHRYEDGYGLNAAALTRMMSEFDVLITVDCGISNSGEVDMLQAAGKDVIIIDHHEIPEYMPSAYAILHPRYPEGAYPWGHLCGAGTSWKFAQALLRHESSPYVQDPDREKWLLDMVMIGTVADVMPLLGENRAIVRFGKEVLMRSRRPGIVSLISQSRIDPSASTAEDIAFRIVPLINAAGRIGHPQTALNALLAATPQQAERAVRELVQLNNDRRTLTKKMMDEAHIEIDHSLPFVFVSNEAWPAGIVGLVAGRLASKFAKPAFVVGRPGGQETSVAVGSARGAGRANVLSALETVRHHTVKLGGHKAAAGFSVLPEKLEHVKQGLAEYFAAQSQEVAPVLHTADAHISPALVSWDVARSLQKFEPFGEGSPKPSFVITNLTVLEKRTVGKSYDHLKLRLLVGDREVEAIGFGLGAEMENLSERVDVIGSLGVHEFRGRETLELQLTDIAAHNTATLTTPE